MSKKTPTAKSFWIVAKYQSGDVYISNDNLYFDKAGRRLYREFKEGITYRAHGQSRRYYYTKLNREKVLINKVITWQSEEQSGPKGSN